MSPADKWSRPAWLSCWSCEDQEEPAMLTTAWNLLRTMKRWIFSSKKDIHVQAAKGNVENVAALLDDDPELVNLVDKMDYGTPLHWAAIYGQVPSCKMLIS